MSDKSSVKELWLQRYPRKFPKADRSVAPVPGAIAVSRAGRDRYRAFIITDVLPAEIGEKTLRVMVADGKLRSTASPKKKNLSHLVLVKHSPRAAEMLATGSFTDSAAEMILKEEWYGTNISINQ